MTIPNLNISDTFQTWFNTTNNVISEINGITVHDIRAGDGIGITSAGNLFTISHGSLVAGGVTFTGAVNFTNSVSFSTSPTIDAMVVKVSPKTSGITIGNVVRMNGTSGLTLAVATNPQNAEVLGIVVGQQGNSDVVAVAGSINNSNFSKTISNILGVNGGTLGVGCAYFLSPEVPGGITNIEPVTYGQVSKPVLLGISAGVGSIIPYRGIQIEGISAGITAELDNKIIISLDATDLISGTVYPSFIQESSNTVKPGDPFHIYSDDDEIANSYGSTWFQYIDYFKTFGKVNGSSTNCGVIFNQDPAVGPQDWLGAESSRFVGFVSKIISKTGNVYILEITLPGGTFKVLESELDTFLWKDVPMKTGTLVAANNEAIGQINKIYNTPLKTDPTTGVPYIVNVKIGNVIKDAGSNEVTINLNAGMLGEARAQLQSVGILTNISQLFNTDFQKLEYTNLLENPNFTINQRGITQINQNTLNANFTPLVDRWFIVKNDIPFTGLTFFAKVHDINRPYSRPISNNPVINTQTGFRSLNRNWIEIGCAYTGTTGYVDTSDPNAITKTQGTLTNPRGQNRIRLENIMNKTRSLATTAFLGNGTDVTYTFGFKAKLTGVSAGQIAGGITIGVIQNFYAEPVWYENVGATAWWQKLEYHIGRYEIIDEVNINPGGGYSSYYVKGFNIKPGNETHHNKSLNLFTEEEGWYSIGLEFPNISGVTFAFSEFILIRGDGVTGVDEHALTKNQSAQEDYAVCSKYYQRTYDWYQPTREDYNVRGRPTWHELQLGKLGIQYKIPYRVPLHRRIWTPTNPITAQIYALDGTTGEAFNVNKNANMFVQGVGALANENQPWQTTPVTRSLSSVGNNLIIDSVTPDGMIVRVNSGATHFDTLRFHYVVDADWHPVQTIKP